MKSQNLQITNTSRDLLNNSDGDKDKKHIQKRTEKEIQGWMVSYLAELLSVEADEIDITVPFSYYGLDSAVAIGLIGDLEGWLGSELDPTLVYDYPTTEALVHHLSLFLQKQN
ncbi:MAG: acyl carrier protein [Scytonematopsis contorta HA4267-MV1]|jgi:acyl carrier protein|nr:acyl carrier protein [Scytonematopsis contorta HA4267-MV1]